MRLPSQGLAWAVVGYQRWISPLFPARCRYYPSCSSYAVDALRAHGLIRGGALAVWRLLRCQPFSLGGVDYVPARATVRWRGAER
ncbi:MAG: membrane protein insertion efficiency factor YidD [Bifidobacteriaceae bacterium]|nr:membrane protein insertion efficiency factor YidD [Bifidobacteriaceae bacterium]